MTLSLFALDSGCPLAPAIADELGIGLAMHESRDFEDGECKLRPLQSPLGCDAFVVISLHGGPVLSPHDKLFRLLSFMATLRDHGAARVTAVVPYLAYARKDRITKPFDPLSLRHVAQLFEAVGIDGLVVLEAHNLAAFQNAFRCQTIHVDAHPIFDAAIDALVRSTDGRSSRANGCALGWSVASPDPGGVKRAQLWREALAQRLGQSVGFALIDKRRSAGQLSSDDLVAGDVKGARVLLYDDLIASGQTMLGAARALREAGAAQVFAVAAHGLFIAPASDLLVDSVLDGVWVSDSVPAFRVPVASGLATKLKIETAVPLLAKAIRARHEGVPWQAD